MSIKRDPMVMAMGGGAAAATATRTSASAWDSTPNTQNRPVPATRNPSAQPRRPTAQGKQSINFKGGTLSSKIPRNRNLLYNYLYLVFVKTETKSKASKYLKCWHPIRF